MRRDRGGTMSARKTLSRLSAAYEQEDVGYKRTGRVSVRAVPDWLKSDITLAASLSISEARHLALELLESAELAERIGDQR